MRISFVLILTFCFSYLNIFAQENTSSVKVDSGLVALKTISNAMITGNTPEMRKEKCFEFIPALVNYLKQPNSYQIDLGYLDNISVLTAPDNSFRILTWNVEETISNTGEYKSYKSTEDLFANQLKYSYYGAIQMNAETLKLFPLSDKSEDIKNPEDLILDNENWYGAVYYAIQQFSLNGENCYALCGWDGNTGISEKKIIDILSFKNEKAIFGMPIIEVIRDGQGGIKNRYVLEYRAGSGVSMNWDEKRNMFIFDFIEAPDEESRGIYPTYIPDGTYNGLKYENNMWRYVERVYEGNNISPDQLFQDRQQKLQDSNIKKSKKKKKKRRKK